MNKSDLITKMTERFGGDRRTAVAAVNGVLEEIEGSVARGERVSLTGFGTFERRERAPRTGRNPRTGEAIQVGRSVAPVFRAGTGFRTLLSQAEGVSDPSGSDAVDGSVPRAGKSPAASPAAPARTVAADAGAGPGNKKAGKKKSGKKARDQAGGKDGKGAHQAGKGKAEKSKAEKSKGKKTAKSLR